MLKKARLTKRKSIPENPGDKGGLSPAREYRATENMVALSRYDLL